MLHNLIINRAFLHTHTHTLFQNTKARHLIHLFFVHLKEISCVKEERKLCRLQAVSLVSLSTLSIDVLMMRKNSRISMDLVAKSTRHFCIIFGERRGQNEMNFRLRTKAPGPSQGPATVGIVSESHLPGSQILTQMETQSSDNPASTKNTSNLRIQ